MVEILSPEVKEILGKITEKPMFTTDKNDKMYAKLRIGSNIFNMRDMEFAKTLSEGLYVKGLYEESLYETPDGQKRISRWLKSLELAELPKEYNEQVGKAVEDHAFIKLPSYKEEIKNAETKDYYPAYLGMISNQAAGVATAYVNTALMAGNMVTSENVEVMFKEWFRHFLKWNDELKQEVKEVE